MRIALITSNRFKAEEFASRLFQHGQKMVSTDIADLSDARISSLLADNDIVIREATTLVSDITGEEITPPFADMELVTNRSEMTVWRRGKDGSVVSSSYRSAIKGFLDINDLRAPSDDVFGWDDIFVSLNSDVTYHELRRRSEKTSARQLNIGRFLADHVHFESRLDMQFFPMEQKDTFEFSTRAYDFVTGNEYIRAGVSGSYLENILSHVLEAGIFFRSASSRREKNYWLPGANAGIPLTSKKDPIHEITFLFHDLMHFQLPDLIPDVYGDLAREVYVTHRVMGEALTLVLADMIFVDNMRRNGVSYDFSKRLIYPLFESLAKEEGVAGLRAIVRAMAWYAVKGDDGLLRAMLKPGEAAVEALEAFKGKYGRFFEEDLRWTHGNFDQFQSNRSYIREWIEIVDKEALAAQGLTTVSAFVANLEKSGEGKDRLDAILDLVFDSTVVPNAASPASGGADVCVSNAFKRYMLGQMSIFARFMGLYQMQAVETKIMEKIQAGRTLAQDEIAKLIALYGVYVDGLERRDLIDRSDALTYRSMHPLFPPFYVFYDTTKLPPASAIS